MNDDFDDIRGEEAEVDDTKRDKKKKKKKDKKAAKQIELENAESAESDAVFQQAESPAPQDQFDLDGFRPSAMMDLEAQKKRK